MAILPGIRFAAWIAEHAFGWRLPVGEWIREWLAKSVMKVIEDLEPEGIEIARANLAKVLDHPATPQDLKDVINTLLAGTKPLPLLLLIPIAVLFLLPTLTAIFQPLGNLLRYAQERVFKSGRLDPMSIITAWRRDSAKYQWLFDDLKDQGFNDERQDALKFATLFYPTAQDLVNWLAKEVFEPDMIDRYGLDDEAPLGRVADFEKAGVNQEQMLNYWRAHWEHASFLQVVEMLHRGLLTLSKEVPTPPTTKGGWAQRDAEGEEAMYEWYRVVEIPPFWRDKLTGIAWNVLTRVDTRRMWDMRSISEERLYSIYHQQGYHGEDLEDMVKWTKIFTDFPVKMAHFTNGWITEQDIRDWLASLDIPADRIEDFIREKTKPAQAERVAGDRNLTMALIVEGVKKGVISEAEGIELLMDLGYDRDEAEYILTVRVETLAGSPENMEQFRDITQKYRKAVGLPSKPVTAELMKAAAELVRLTKDVEALRQAVKEERDKLVPDEILPEEATARLKELELPLHRAEAELHAAQVNYNALLAEWRHKEAE